ncbi:MAG: Hsp33 family molecular chaperone HslO [Myxococcota bacterium]|jgi:redox-regulated HSP33 family molecular chaperone|nr:Hsp33 family molecular chaperone HslO [Myxococcota bacterium]
MPVFAHFYRFLHEEHGLLVVKGELRAVLDAWQQYHQRHGIPTPPEAVSQMGKRLLAAAILGAMSFVENESWGWTMTLPESPWGFFCAAEPEGFVSLRHREAEASKSLVVLQRQRENGPLRQSSFTPETCDPLSVIEQFFSISEQIPTRLGMSEDGRCVLVQALPGAELTTLAGLDEAALIETVERWTQGEAKETNEKLYWYGCRCDEQWLRLVVGSISNAQQAELWGSEAQLHIECPRCGRAYVLTRQEADDDGDGSGAMVN